jgi:hypothetical protein
MKLGELKTAAESLARYDDRAGFLRIVETFLVRVNRALQIVSQIVVAEPVDIVGVRLLGIGLYPMSWEMTAGLGRYPNHFLKGTGQNLAAKPGSCSQLDRQVGAGKKAVARQLLGDRTGSSFDLDGIRCRYNGFGCRNGLGVFSLLGAKYQVVRASWQAFEGKATTTISYAALGRILFYRDNNSGNTLRGLAVGNRHREENEK